MDHTDSPAIAESPVIHSPSLPAVIPNPDPMQSVLQSLRLSSLFRSINRFLPPTDADRRRAQMASQAREGAHTSPSDILAPILKDLQELKALTPENLPLQNPSSDTRSHAQALKEKLLPIGEFITNYLDGVPEADRGSLELRTCRYIADGYWPLPVENYTYLKVQEIYRNARYKKAQRAFRAALVELSQLHQASPDYGSSGNPAPEVAADQDAPPVNSSSVGSATTSGPMFGQDTLCLNTAAQRPDVPSNTEEKDLKR
ncbi:hypothetical protein ACET3X_002981 [Alternaria dauci]|uniref:Chromodomain-helicase-DNA-binding protein 1-like C-terminal domain-containing protein n=1 Tax=Alternaria dauci TaxID=48095 RepID=A0ABR3UT05_9PLEO